LKLEVAKANTVADAETLVLGNSYQESLVCLAMQVYKLDARKFVIAGLCRDVISTCLTKFL
jgi:hypothetical protein